MERLKADKEHWEDGWVEVAILKKRLKAHEEAMRGAIEDIKTTCDFNTKAAGVGSTVLFGNAAKILRARLEEK